MTFQRTRHSSPLFIDRREAWTLDEIEKVARPVLRGMAARTWQPDVGLTEALTLVTFAVYIRTRVPKSLN